MSVRVIFEPLLEPVTLTEAKLHLRVDHSTDDDLITALIVAAREHVEHVTGRALIEQTLELVIDAFPAAEIRLPRPRLMSITSIKHDDTAGVEQTMDAADYTLDTYSEPGWVFPVYGGSWPSTIDAANAVRVRYVAGYGATAASVPAGIKAWILVRVGALYRHREELADSRFVAPSYVDRLLDAYRVYA